eukprot:m51a1_g14237 hypothetical protein (557) ;mRNA; f:227546-229572
MKSVATATAAVALALLLAASLAAAVAVLAAPRARDDASASADPMWSAEEPSESSGAEMGVMEVTSADSSSEPTTLVTHAGPHVPQAPRLTTPIRVALIVGGCVGGAAVVAAATLAVVVRHVRACTRLGMAFEDGVTDSDSAAVIVPIDGAGAAGPLTATEHLVVGMRTSPLLKDNDEASQVIAHPDGTESLEAKCHDHVYDEASHILAHGSPAKSSNDDDGDDDETSHIVTHDDDDETSRVAASPAKSDHDNDGDDETSRPAVDDDAQTACVAVSVAQCIHDAVDDNQTAGIASNEAACPAAAAEAAEAATAEPEDGDDDDDDDDEEDDEETDGMQCFRVHALCFIAESQFGAVLDCDIDADRDGEDQDNRGASGASGERRREPEPAAVSLQREYMQQRAGDAVVGAGEAATERSVAVWFMRRVLFGDDVAMPRPAGLGLRGAEALGRFLEGLAGFVRSAAGVKELHMMGGHMEAHAAAIRAEAARGRPLRTPADAGAGVLRWFVAGLAGPDNGVRFFRKEPAAGLGTAARVLLWAGRYLAAERWSILGSSDVWNA